MKQLLLIIGLLCIILFNSSIGNSIRYNTIEPFVGTSKNTIVLLGDSMLKNNSYVKPGFAVDDLLRKQVGSNKTIVNYAREEAQIADVYTQLTHLYNDNNNTLTIFLSVGGNNILSNYGAVSGDDVKSIFEKYKNLIDAIKTKLPNSKLFLLNIYHTYDVEYAKLNPMIDVWNQLLNNYYYNDFYHVVSGIVDVKSALSQPSDLTFKIEPSESGGEKITTKIREHIVAI
jgi:hypothetical protein